MSQDAVQQEAGDALRQLAEHAGDTSTALMIRDDAKFTAAMTRRALKLKDAALEQSALIARVSTREELDRSVMAQTVINDLRRDFERARVACKEPALRFCQNIDAAPKAADAELEVEADRLEKLNGNFAALENTKAMAAQAVASEELSKIEREREQKVASAGSLEEVGNIREEYAQKAAELPRMIYAPVRAEGQKLKDDWEYEITNYAALFNAYPACVKMEGRPTEIKAMLNNGIELPGVLAKRIVKSGTKSRRERETKAIEA